MNGWVELSIAFVTGVLGPLSVIWLKNFLDKRKKKPDMVMDTLRVSELVTTRIEHFIRRVNQWQNSL
jgi:capsular polysaccharide biosynthesis protein